MTTLSSLSPANLQLVNDWINADSKDTTWKLHANFIPSLCNDIHTAEYIENKLKEKISSIKELDIQPYNFQDIGGGIILVFALNCEFRKFRGGRYSSLSQEEAEPIVESLKSRDISTGLYDFGPQDGYGTVATLSCI